MKTVTKFAAWFNIVPFSIAIAYFTEAQPLDNGISSIETLADEYLSAWIEKDALMGTYYSIEAARHDQLPDNSLSALNSWQQKEDAWLIELKGMEIPTEVGSRDWVTFGLLLEQLESSIALRICRNELWQASTSTSWHTGLPFVFELQPIESLEERNQALERLSKVAGYIDTEITNLRRGLELGYSAPATTVKAVPSQVRSLISEKSIFLSPAHRSNDKNFAVSAENIYRAQIRPALERYAEFIEHHYLKETRTTLPITENNQGSDCYPKLIRSFVTLPIPARAIHKIGLQQVDKIRGELRQTLDEHFGGGSISKFLRHINENPQFTFESEDAVLAYSRKGLIIAKAAMPEAFSTLPVADVVVRPYPNFAESGSGEYHSSSKDGSRPGIFYISVVDPTKRSKASQLSTLYHETFPGHHLQGAIALELGDKFHPLAHYLWNSGFGEGWALYSERLADELGLYHSPIDKVGLYSDQLARASRLVIDTGIHTMGWTRERAINYMMDNSGWSAVDIQNEIDRYISWPGQATSYMLGMLEILALRAKAEKELGPHFDLRVFHDRAVGMGSITLPMLQESILQLIKEKKSSLLKGNH